MTRVQRRTPSSRLRDDSGVSAVIISLLIVFIIIPVAAVSVDLSNAFSNRRQMQNAADAAAQAGADKMNQVRLNLVTTNFGQALDSTVRDVAAANGSSTSTPDYSCNVAKVSYTGDAAHPVDVALGPSCLTWDGSLTTYNAVTVHTQRSIDTFFARAMLDATGAVSTTANATATATIQAVQNQYVGLSPFAMCANAYIGSGNHQTIDTSVPALLVDDTTLPIPNTSPQQYYYKINVNAEGTNYPVWSNGGGSSNVSDCGFQSQNFNGLICGMYQPASDPTNNCAQPISLPDDPPSGAMLSITNGAVVGPTLATYAGYPACDPAEFGGVTVDFAPCAMAVPICDYGVNPAGSTPSLLHCITFGLFYLSPGTQHHSDNGCDQTPGFTEDTICGKFLGPATDVVGGTPTAGTPGTNDPVRIALVQ